MIGDALRRIAAQYIAPKSKRHMPAIKLADEVQCGAGLKGGGVEICYTLPGRVPGALAAARIPLAMPITDGEAPETPSSGTRSSSSRRGPTL